MGTHAGLSRHFNHIKDTELLDLMSRCLITYSILAKNDAERDDARHCMNILKAHIESELIARGMDINSDDEH